MSILQAFETYLHTGGSGVWRGPMMRDYERTAFMTGAACMASIMAETEAPPPADGLQQIRDAYLLLLQMPVNGARIRNQETYCALRDFIAAAERREPEQVQTEYETRAARVLFPT